MNKDCETRIIVDTNLWISFLIGRKLSALLEVLSLPDVELVVSQELLDEIRLVASRPKFSKYFLEDKIQLLLDYMKEETVSFVLGNDIPARCRDAKDDYLLELAKVSEADYLITGDQDLLALKKIESCQIVTVMEFDTLIASLGYPSTLHENLEEYYNIVIGE